MNHGRQTGGTQALDKKERRKLLVEWNDTAADYPADRCVHELFEAQAERRPEAVAVVSETGQLTYRELNERANRVAHFLRRRGVGPDSLVGISLERSLEVVVGIYGILKAGGAYVPLDPAYPQQRLASMIGTARVQVLLTQETLGGIFQGIPGLDIIRLDADWPAIAAESAENAKPLATPDNLIYVIFTSGSTGTPKGAAVYHKGFTNLLHWFVTEFAITEADRALLVSSLSFDLTQKNLYATLIRGGALVLFPPGPYDVALLSRLIQKHGITLINCTPSAFYPLIEPPDDESLSKLASLRVVFLGGEPISIPRLTPWLTHTSCRADVANTYGPTECTDICGAYRLTRGNLNQYGFVPLGRPIYNVQLVIADEEMNPCPAGVAGELCVAGAGIGAGYLNDPEMTAAKFVPNPFPEIPGPAIYRTGDQARRLPDGVIEFLGRLDHQVKIRGFRIELHEIENALSSHPSVREAIVVANGAADGGDPRLDCFFTVKEGRAPDATALKQFLAERLPAYMVPSSFHALPKFPLSPNGKVDRRALCESFAAPRPATAAPPLNELEQQVRQIWLDVLHCREAGLDDNFFDLGGNSIHVAQVHVRLQKLVGREFPITEMFSYTTIRALAARFGAEAKKDGAIEAIQERARRQRDALAARRLARR